MRVWGIINLLSGSPPARFCWGTYARSPPLHTPPPLRTAQHTPPIIPVPFILSFLFPGPVRDEEVCVPAACARGRVSKLQNSVLGCALFLRASYYVQELTKARKWEDRSLAQSIFPAFGSLLEILQRQGLARRCQPQRSGRPLSCHLLFSR